MLSVHGEKEGVRKEITVGHQTTQYFSRQTFNNSVFKHSSYSHVPGHLSLSHILPWTQGSSSYRHYVNIGLPLPLIYHYLHLYNFMRYLRGRRDKFFSLVVFNWKRHFFDTLALKVQFISYMENGV